MPVLEVENLSKTFGEGELAVHALREATFSVEAGELVALLGPSGSGKSTLLLCISLIQEPSSGRIAISGRDVWRDGPLGLDERRFRRENIGFIFQGHNLIPFLTAEENIALARELNGASARESAARANCLATWKSAIAPAPIPAASRAASSSAWRSAARWPTSRRSSSPTSPPLRSTPSAA